MTEYSREDHILRHRFLHQHLDELVADFIDKTGKMPSQTSVMELMQWANEQTKNPTTKSAPILAERLDEVPR